MDLDSVTDTLKSKYVNILTKRDISYIKAVSPDDPHREEGVKRLLKTLTHYKTNRAFKELIHALDKAGQPHLGDLLMNAAGNN